MPNIKFEPTGYCVVRRAVNIDYNQVTHVINGVFGVFNTRDEAEDFISNFSDNAIVLNKDINSYLDGESYFTISNINKPVYYKKSSIVQRGPYTTYKSWRDAAKKHGGVRLEGDKDIAQIFDANGYALAEWDGAEGFLYLKKVN